MIYFNIGWMHHYQGPKLEDRTHGAHGYLQSHHHGAECYNFASFDGRVTGARPGDRRRSGAPKRLQIERLRAGPRQEAVDGAVVVWIARKPNSKQTYVVGWYLNATVYRTPKPSGRRINEEEILISAEASAADATLLAVSDRNLVIESKRTSPEGFGQSPTWYGSERINQRVWSYIRSRLSPATPQANHSQSVWIEITNRNDIGTNLKAPALDKAGKPHWSYENVCHVRAGDTVYHYDAAQQAVVGISTAVGHPWSDKVVWAARGTRSRGIAPHLQDGWYMGLEGYRPLSTPLTRAELTRRRDELWALRDALQQNSGAPHKFPFIPYRADEVRALQAYLVPFPQELVRVFPELQVRDDITGGETSEVGQTYRPADEETSVAERDPFHVDPALVERALRSHAQTQNALAAHLSNLGRRPLSPDQHSPSFDLGWWHAGHLYVAEIKSREDENEERQLRLGLGQVLRYRQKLTDQHGGTVKAVLALSSRPRDLSWLTLCNALGVRLCWFPDFKLLEE